MKKLICFFLMFALSVSLLSISAFADLDANLKNSADSVLLNNDSLTDDYLTLIFVQTMGSMYSHGLLSDDQIINIVDNIGIDALHSKNLLPDDIYAALSNILTQTIRTPAAQGYYSFGQGTYIVGQDLQPGTYDVKCESMSDEGYSDSINALGDVYSGLGLNDYGSAFGSLGDLYGALETMTISIEYSNGTYANYLTLKSGETARVILENGMRLNLKDGTSTFTFIR